MVKTTEEIINSRNNGEAHIPHRKWYSEDEVDKLIADCFKIKMLTEEFEKTGIVKCTYCFKSFTKIDEYTYKPNCDCIKKDIRLNVG